MVSIQARGFSLTQALKKRVQKRISFILGNVGNPVINVDVKLSDINGPKGGVDKKCQVFIQLKGHASVVVADTQNDMYYAIDRACSRALRTVRRRVSQKNTNKGFRHRALPGFYTDMPEAS